MNKLPKDEDIDVAAERDRVTSGGADDDLLRLENLTKVSFELLSIQKLKTL